MILINLEQLSIAQNEIKIIDAQNIPFASLINLKHLNLSGNEIDNIYYASIMLSQVIIGNT